MVKTYENLFGRICRVENLEYAFHKARKGKSNMQYVKDFEADLYGNLLRLKAELETMTYQPRPLRKFVIRDPKTRLISAPHFRDRIVHHALCNVIEPIFERTFIHDSYASRKGKGTHAALHRFDEFKRKVSCNGRLVNGAKDGNMVVGYVLKCDIRHYFASVDHETLMRIIGRKIRDARVLWLIRNIMISYEPCGRGMPIGALTSQLFANIYLNEMDYFVKHCLKAKYYMRYMDDFVLLHESKDVLLEWRRQIGGFLGSELKLELHPEKSNICPLSGGVSLLGYRVFCHYRLLRRSNTRLFEQRIADFSRLCICGEVPYEKTKQSIESWMAYAGYADSYKLRKRLISSFPQVTVRCL